MMARTCKFSKQADIVLQADYGRQDMANRGWGFGLQYSLLEVVPYDARNLKT